jgi:phosphoribosylaminoimidazolecarboxamide formyltransferase/IMP cyclohydrolase
MPRALLSVSDKTGLVSFARGLVAHDFVLVSTGGTARALAEAGLEVTSIADLTGVPEMLDGRVKTLHPAVHGGILARRDRPDHLAALARQGIGLIDLVVVNLYPFADAARRLDTPFDALIEEIDIGGPSLVRAAAKNFRDVLVVVDPADYERLLSALEHPLTIGMRYDLAKKAFAHTAAYDAMIVNTLAIIERDSDRFERRPRSGPFAQVATLSLTKLRDLRYGENPHQRAAWYAPLGVGVGFGATTIVQGMELSYTNLLDLDAAVRFVLGFEEPAAAVIKHTNPCGVAIGVSAADAYVRARDADRLASFGGIVALNRAIDVAVAEAIVSTKIDAVIAPAVDEAARTVLGRKANMRVVTVDFTSMASTDVEFRSILGAMLVQERDQTTEAQVSWSADTLPDGFRVATIRQPTAAEWTALRFAWRVCAHVKSNTVVFSDDQRTRAIGAGQMSRVDAVRVAVTRGGAGVLAGSVAASDAFFPFRDGLDAVAAAGATAVIQPGGSVRDDEVIAAANEHGLTMVFTGRRHFKH